MACRVVARCVCIHKVKRSAFAKATARQSSLHSTTRAKTGGKGIRTPDFQLAKLALYQLSYAPCELSILDCGSRIANVSETHAPPRTNFPEGLPTCYVDVVRGFGKSRSRMPILRIDIRPSCGFRAAKLRPCAEKEPSFPFLIVPRQVPPNTPLTHP